jgi:thiamine-monophosphate kinase
MITQAFTPISESGRNRLIQELSKKIGNPSDSVLNLVRSIGDDCAVVRSDHGRFLLYSTETYVEGVDFDLTYTPLTHLGYKMVSAAVSDILAMNGTPESLLISVAIPNKISTEMIHVLYEGLIRASDVYKAPIIGGDITASQGSLVISITVNGAVQEQSITYRSGAQIGDAICVTGDLGASYAGLRILLREKAVWGQEPVDSEFSPDLSEYEYVVKRQLLPEARTDLIDTLRTHGMVPTSMIDISKNALQDLMQVMVSSQKGAQLYEAAVPIALETRAMAEELEEDVVQYALQGGEDYELLFTLPEKDVNRLVNHFKDFVVIGRVTSKHEGFRMQLASGEEMQFDLEKLA